MLRAIVGAVCLTVGEVLTIPVVLGPAVIRHHIFGFTVEVDLQRGTMHEGGDLDRLAGIEILAGSPQSDLLLGSSRSDFIIARRAGPAHIRRNLTGNAEVHQHHASGIAHDQVLRLYVAVNDLLLVHVLERLAGLARVLERPLERQARPALLLDEAPEVPAAHKLHHQVITLAVADVAEDLDDPRVAQAREQARLDLEAFPLSLLDQALEGDLAATAVRGSVDGTHRTARNRLDDLVLADSLHRRNLPG